MNELGILVDISHLSDGGFWDVAGQKRELSGVSISSPSKILSSLSRPNSNFVSAMMILRLKAKHNRRIFYRVRQYSPEACRIPSDLREDILSHIKPEFGYLYQNSPFFDVKKTGFFSVVFVENI